MGLALSAPALAATPSGGGGTTYGGVDVPAGFHAFGAVNDPLSHGQIGDNFLSLNEAIQMHNNTLLLNQLSAAEQAQVQLIPGTGQSTFLSWARFNGANIPVITIERDLDVIVNTTYGLFLSSDNGSTTLDFSGPNVTRGMLATTNSLQMRDFVFSGGPYGIDVVQTDIAGQIGFAINDCRFEDQSQFGVRIRSTTANGIGKGYLERCEFDNAATGFIWDAAAAGRTSFFDLHDCRIEGGDSGVEIAAGDGGVARYVFDRLVIDALNTGITIDRLASASRPMLLLWRNVEARAADAVRIAGHPTGTTTLQLQMCHFAAGSGSVALALGSAPGDDIGGLLEDSTFSGDLTVRTGGGSAALVIQNVRCDTGNTVLTPSASQAVDVIDSRFDQGTVQNAGSAALSMTNCCVTGAATGTILAADSFLPNAGAGVTQTTPRPAEQLGSMRVLPTVPTIGANVIFEADLPPGLFGSFLLGFTDPNPTLLAQPLHIYSIFNSTLLLPGIFRFQQQYVWPIANNPNFIGIDLVATIAVLPDPGVSALPVQIAPGRRFALQ